MRLFVPAWLDPGGALATMALKKQYYFKYQAQYFSAKDAFLEVCITDCQILQLSCWQFQVVS